MFQRRRERRKNRLAHYDYSKAGYYFVTICVNEKINLFWKKVGAIPRNRPKEKGENMVSPVQLSVVGLMIDKWWRKMFEKYCNEIEIDEFIIMPNHVHGIIQIVGAIPCNRPDRRGENVVSPVQNIPNDYEGLGKYISWFKRMSTNEYIRNVRTNGWHPFDKRIWQRNYYDHVIRNDVDLNRIRIYIRDNPLKWGLDRNNPKIWI